MNANEIPVPHLTTAHSGPLYHVEKILLNHVAPIEAWFRQKWKETPAPLTSSVDLRHAGFKLAPVDTNLFPAGFNNLNPDFLPLCVQAAQSVLIEYIPDCTKILILPESHTRNKFYLQSLNILRTIFIKAGFIVRIGSLDPEIKSPTEVVLENGDSLLLEPLRRQGDRVGLEDFNPCFLLLNNDMSSGVPELLEGLEQRIRPTAKLGWASRLKSSHFQFFDEVAREFAELVDIDSWLINPYFSAIDGVDFMAQEGVEQLALEVDKILGLVADKYAVYGIKEKPFAVVKADNGTYGMSVMMVHDANEIRQLNRKQRTRMSSSKGSRKVDRVIIQEGVYTFETMPNGAVAEPVVYMIGQFVVGGFYRVHQGRGIDENLNAPGMHFEPLAFAQACNMPCDELEVVDCPNRFYVYGVIARLAALAAAREIRAIGGE
ncbi:glutamate--cysteine ligase [Legionella quateirensis]|uniref:Glutamate--cysteine ligase n=1 Tax=Legionella quateirensis TaxID=45072 RepID=A0A378KTK4_9GAMM|nr:glutamate--cysteine ligase [Legionella quateirensis]KTD51256.1 glutamate--cysteine ligase [Legionella quateirensis]STY17499.1 glutamate--cysteine ligase [Legionella quateirensis]